MLAHPRWRCAVRSATSSTISSSATARFDSWTHLNQLAEQWLRAEAGQRRNGTVHEVVAARFAREAPVLRPLPTRHYDTSYWETRQVSWDGYIKVRGNRYSVPAVLVGHRVSVRITLDDVVRIYDGDTRVGEYRFQPATQGWVTVPAYHTPLWRQALEVERRPLTVYEEVASCS